MSALKIIQATITVILATSPGVVQQPAAPTPPPQAPTGQEKTTTAQDTQKRLEALACGPAEVHHSVKTEKTLPPLPEQPQDKALIYVLRPTHYGGSTQSKLAVDGKWVGVNRMMTYFYFALEPGPHYFCSQTENRSLLSLVVEPGKTYFLQQKIRMGMFKAQNDLQLLEEDEGKRGLAKCKLSVSEEKH